MRFYSVFVLLTTLLVSPYAYSQIPSCPCDDIVLTSGNTGNDIFEMLCSDGELTADAEFVLTHDTVEVFESGVLIYQTNAIGGGFGCGISDASQGSGTEITEQEYENCRQKLIEGCSLKNVNPIPTLSEWGLIAMAGALGVIGLYVVTRRRKAAA